MTSEEPVSVPEPVTAPETFIMPTWPGKRLETDMDWPGEGPFFYTHLTEPTLSYELARISSPKTRTFQSSSEGAKLRVDSVTMQPCLIEAEKSQDRLFVERVEGVGTLIGVLDGHGGHETVDYTLANLPSMLSSDLASAPSNFPIPSILKSSINELDDRITTGITDLFPPGLKGSSAEAIDKIVSRSHKEIMLGMRGTTVLVAFVDEKKEDLWVAGVGDCLAVLGTQDESGEWQCEVLTKSHNGAVPQEAERIRNAHPNEPEALTRGRVLGAIAVTRAVGDHVFKLPASYTRRVFLSPRAPGFKTHTSIQDVVLPRIQTPPYLTCAPDFTHVDLTTGATTFHPAYGSASSPTPPRRSGKDGKRPKRVLILCSDGLPTVAMQMNEHLWRGSDITEKEKEKAQAKLEARATKAWVDAVGRALTSSSRGRSDSPSSEASVTSAALDGDDAGSKGKQRADSKSNLALALLRSVLASADGMGTPRTGGEDEREEGEKLLSRWLTVEMFERWMDDITIQVVTL